LLHEEQKGGSVLLHDNSPVNDVDNSLNSGTHATPSHCRVVLLKRRSDFLAVRDHGAFLKCRSFSLQIASVSFDEARCRDHTNSTKIIHDELGPFIAPAQGSVILVGYTASRKIGGAVVRNRAKRRLRALVAVELRDGALFDSVVVPCTTAHSSRCGSSSNPLNQLVYPLQFSKRTQHSMTQLGVRFPSVTIVLIATRRTVDAPWRALREDFNKLMRFWGTAVATQPHSFPPSF
jgi:ribonuclease P protein component